MKLEAFFRQHSALDVAKADQRVRWRLTAQESPTLNLLRDAADAYNELGGKSSPRELTTAYCVKCLMWLMLKRLFGDKAQWRKQYDEVAEWLNENDGKGLFLYGSCGQGKTVMARQIIIPAVEQLHGKVISYINATELEDSKGAWWGRKLLCIDDIGAEAINAFKNMAFGQIVDAAEKQGGLLVLTTNLNQEQMMERYGERICDRLFGLTRMVVFNEGKSMRR